MRLAACVETLLESHRLMQPFRLTEMPLVNKHLTTLAPQLHSSDGSRSFLSMAAAGADAV